MSNKRARSGFNRRGRKTSANRNVYHWVFSWPQSPHSLCSFYWWRINDDKSSCSSNCGRKKKRAKRANYLWKAAICFSHISNVSMCYENTCWTVFIRALTKRKNGNFLVSSSSFNKNNNFPRLIKGNAGWDGVCGSRNIKPPSIGSILPRLTFPECFHFPFPVISGCLCVTLCARLTGSYY